VMNDFYCDEVVSGNIQVDKVKETEYILAFHHTKPFYPIHVVAIPKKHIPSLTALEESDHGLLLELMLVIKEVAAEVTEEHGSCKVLTNLGTYQDSYCFGPAPEWQLKRK
jgi:histidine triad (HIT) family protein